MVVAPEFRVFVCNTRTGHIDSDLIVGQQSWGLRLNEGGTLSVEIPVNAQEVAGLNLRALTQPVFQSLGIAYGPRILECGPIWSRHYAGGVMSLEAEGLWSIFNARKALAGAALVWGSSAITASKIGPVTGSLGDIARELVRISIEDNPYGVGDLNIRLPEIQGGSHERTYLGYELGWIGARLEELTAVENGPDIRFRPRFQDEDPMRVEWVMEYGSEEQPLLQQTGQDWIWDGGASGSSVVDLETEEDATGQAARAWVPGAGQERAMGLAYATNQDLIVRGMPWLEVDEKRDVEDGNVLQGHANRLRAGAAAPVVIVGAKVRADGSPLLGEYLPGDWASFVVPEGHPTLDAGEQRVRIMAVDGDATGVVSLAVSPFLDTTTDNRAAKQYTRSSDDNSPTPGTWASLPDGTWTEQPAGTWNEVVL